MLFLRVLFRPKVMLENGWDASALRFRRFWTIQDLRDLVVRSVVRLHRASLI